MIDSLPPGVILMLGGLLAPLFRGRAAAAWCLLLPALGMAQLLAMPQGLSGHLELFGYELVLVRVDALSRVFGIIFHLAAFLSALYAFHVRDRLQQAAGMIYAGSAIAAVFAGDLLTLFVWWEITAVSSVALIWANRTERSNRAGFRYLVVQVGSGVLLLAGVLMHVAKTGSIEFGNLGLEGPGHALIFLAFGVKCAFPFLHNWLQDAYPEGTVTGTVFLSAFTTKLAVYALARGFPGTEILVPIGVAMTLFPIFFAVIENDLRRVLAYSLNNQLGFMVVGIGIGTQMALNGTVAHAFCHILYKALLFMSMGAVLYRTGTIKATELGGLYKSMPFTAVFCLIGAASISAFPFFSGFVSKSLILTAAGDQHRLIVWLGLVVASAGVMEHSGIKIPFFSFFAHDSGKRVKEAPWNMLLAMGITAFLCVGLGCFPKPLYALLPYDVDFQPYTGGHVLTQFQLLLFATLAFGVLLKTGIYPPERRSVNLDFDWTYRRAAPRAIALFARAWSSAATAADGLRRRVASRLEVTFFQRFDEVEGLFGRTWPTGHTALWAAILLGLFLLLYYV